MVRKIHAWATRLTGGLIRGLLLAFLLGNLFLPLAKGEEVPPRKAVLVIATGLSVDDLATHHLPNLQRLLTSQGAIALLNTRTAGAFTPENGYVSLGAGARALGSPNAGLTLEAGESYLDTPAPLLYARHTGRKPPEGNLLMLGIAELQQINGTLDHTVVPGALGEALHQAGKRVALIGNSDCGGVLFRLAGTVAMNSQGLIDKGEVNSSLLIRDPLRPYGTKTDYRRLLTVFERYYPQTDLVIIETGDTLRLEQYRPWLTQAAYSQEKKLALAALDDFLGRLFSRIDWESTRLLLVSPHPSLENETNRLSVVIMAGKGITPGWLVSGTTRRPGLVTNTDIAPTILTWLGVPVPYTMSGRNITAIPHSDPLPPLVQENHRIVAVFGQRPTILQTYVVLQILVILAGIVFLFLVPRVPRRWLSILQRLLVGVTTIPLLILLLPPFFSTKMMVNLFSLGVGAVVLTYLATRWSRHPLDPFLLIYTLTSLTIAVDVVRGAPLIRASLLGYDPMGGARFYGLGNEFMGVYIGAAILALTMLGERWPRLRPYTTTLVGLGFLLSTYLIAAPHLGANVGGAISVMFAFAWTWFALRDNRVTLPALLWTVVVIFLTLTGLTIYDASLPGGTSTHLGQTWHLVKAGGASQFLMIVVRKLAMNWKLMKYTIWSRGLIAFIAAFIVLTYRPVGVLKKVTRRYPLLTKGLWGSLAGTVAAFIANDSGVVAAATLLLYPTALYVYLTMEETRLRREQPSHQPPYGGGS